MYRGDIRNKDCKSIPGHAITRLWQRLFKRCYFSLYLTLVQCKYTVLNVSHHYFGKVLHFADSSNVYKPTCNAHRQGCEVGDLSAKYNTTINLASTRSNPEKLFFTDVLPLAGGYTIIRRAVTIHFPNQGAPRFVCGDIMEKVF